MVMNATIFLFGVFLLLELSVCQAKKHRFHDLYKTKEEQQTTRNKKIYGLFSLVSFPNSDCDGNNGYNGTCMSASECIGRGGQAEGSCAQGFGTCCFITISTCGGTITRNRTFIRNPNFPAAYTVSNTETCTYTFTKCSTNICQLRLDFETFELSQMGILDTDGIAGNAIGIQALCTRSIGSTDGITSDEVTMTHAEGWSEDVKLCGKNSGYHVYLDMGADGIQTDTTKFEIILDGTYYGSEPRSWNIMATQIECDSLSRAPDNCLQYHYGNTGTGIFEAFNFKENNANKLGHLSGKYAICTRREKNMCVMGMTPPKFSVDSLGWSVNGGKAIVQVRGGCNSIAPRQGCSDDYVQILQASVEQSGAGPFYKINDPTSANCVIGNANFDRCAVCDRFCGKKLGVIRKGHRGDADHAVIYTRRSPFQINVNFNPQGHPQALLNKGFRLNYWQLPC